MRVRCHLRAIRGQRTLREIEELFLHPVREVVLTDGNQLRERLRSAGDRADIPSSRIRAVLEQIAARGIIFQADDLSPAGSDPIVHGEGHRVGGIVAALQNETVHGPHGIGVMQAAHDGAFRRYSLSNRAQVPGELNLREFTVL